MASLMFHSSPLFVWTGQYVGFDRHLIIAAANFAAFRVLSIFTPNLISLLVLYALFLCLATCYLQHMRSRWFLPLCHQRAVGINDVDS